MTNPTHTPFVLPLIASKIIGYELYGVVQRDNKIICGARFTEDEAAYIVKCVNEYEDLRKAAVETQEEFTRVIADYMTIKALNMELVGALKAIVDNKDIAIPEDVYEKIKAALAKVGTP